MSGDGCQPDLPRLTAHDRFGHRVDEVAFHPAWHELMGYSVGWGLHADPWNSHDKGAHTARAAGFLMWTQVEPGHLCPISMTYASVPALRHAGTAGAEWIPRQG